MDKCKIMGKCNELSHLFRMNLIIIIIIIRIIIINNSAPLTTASWKGLKNF